MTENLRHTLPSSLNGTSITEDEGVEMNITHRSTLATSNKAKKFAIEIPSSPPVKIDGNQGIKLVRYIYESYFVGSIAVAILGGLSRFRAGHSTKAQRAWTMTWLAVGILAGPLKYPLITIGTLFYGSSFFGPMTAIIYSTPAIGGFVVVAQMLRAYGDCFRIF